MKSLKSVVLVLFLPTTYGLLVRGFYGGNPWEELYSVMLLSFLVLVPIAMGMLTVVFAPQTWRERWAFILFAPWAPVFLLFAITMALAWEGWICWIMILPYFLVLTMTGGIIGRYLRIYFDRRAGRINVAIIMLLPFLIAPVESQIEIKPKIYSAETYIEINAPKDIIWNNVTRVKTISEQEDSRKISKLLGFPRPLYAELDTLQSGGRRLATFDKGLVFDEVVYLYEHQKKMSFNIIPLTKDIPATTLDQHITVGGKYFTVLEGSYELEDLGENHYRLHLTSKFQLQTSFNFYSGLWSEWIMKDIQENILEIIKARSEAKQ